METRKCPNCGGGLELTRSRNMLACPFCGSKFEVDAEDRESGSFSSRRKTASVRITPTSAR